VSGNRQFSCQVVRAVDGSFLGKTDVEDLRLRREEVSRVILEEEARKSQLEKEAKALQERLEALRESIAKKATLRKKYDKVRRNIAWVDSPSFLAWLT
jgi:phage-related minor tail protein